MSGGTARPERLPAARRPRYVINAAGRSALASSVPALTAEERDLLARIAARGSNGVPGSGPRMSSAEAVRALARLQSAGLISARDWHPSRTETDDSQIDSETAKAVGQLRRTGYYISLASQLTGVLNPKRSAADAAAPPARHLLLATDDPAVASLIRMMLAPEGFSVRAIRLRDAGSPDMPDTPDTPPPQAILIDNAPYAEAIAAMRAVRRSRNMHRCGVALLCETGGSAGVLDALAAGADALIAKPFEVETIVRVINALAAH